MPAKIPDGLPAVEILAKENVFVMPQTRAQTQDIRPLQIAILNLMPNKETTETQLIRLLSNTPLQVEVTLLNMASHQSTHTADAHLNAFYKTFEEIQHSRFDGLVITGAPVERLDFADVDYWEELQAILNWSQRHVFSTLHICWAAQAGLYHHYGIGKHEVDQKVFGVFSHSVAKPTHRLTRGFDDCFIAPHSRHTEIKREDVLQVAALEILAESDEAGVFLVASKDGRQVFISGHAEYDAESLHDEYCRDISRGMDIEPPKHYYPNDNPEEKPCVSWRGHANLLFANWLNYFVYQETPYDIENIR